MSLILLVVSLYLTLKIYRLVQFRDPSLLLSITSITLALICIVSYAVLSSVGNYAEPDTFFATLPGLTLIQQLFRVGVMFIFCAFVFDLYKWCIFIVATREHNIYNTDSYISQKTKLQWIIGIVQVLNIVCSLSLIITLFETEWSQKYLDIL